MLTLVYIIIVSKKRPQLSNQMTRDYRDVAAYTDTSWGSAENGSKPLISGIFGLLRPTDKAQNVNISEDVQNSQVSS